MKNSGVRIALVVVATVSLGQNAMAESIFLKCAATNIKTHQEEITNWEFDGSDVYVNGSKYPSELTKSTTALELTTRNDNGSITTKIDRITGKYTMTFYHRATGVLETTWYGSCAKSDTPTPKF